MARDASARPRDPLRTFQFRVRVLSVGGDAPLEYVAGCRSVSGVTMHVTPFEVWEGGNNLHRYVNPNKVNWEPIVLEEGLALDDTLARWADAVLEFARSGRKPSAALKREVFIDVWDPYVHGPNAPGAGAERARTYRVHNAWISKYQALPKLDATASEVALVSVELMHEGWELDAARPAPEPALPPGTALA